jgi:hypothetical protein
MIKEVQSIDQEDPQQKKRFFVIQEIISTEETYLSRLKLTIDNVIIPLKSLKILDKKDLAEQFDGFEDIYQLHEKHSLEGTSSRNLKFIELFKDIADNCKVYSQYLANYEPAMERRGHLLTTNRKFSDYIENVEKEPCFLGQRLESMLILPVQRIPRYRLLMEQLLKYTSESHEDYGILQQALEMIESTANINNEAIRARENKNKIMEIMMQIEPTTRIDLLEDRSRLFVIEGALQKQCRYRKIVDFSLVSLTFFFIMIIIFQKKIQGIPILVI